MDVNKSLGALSESRKYWKTRALSAEDELAAARERAAWQPIETAPKDGTEVLLAVTMRAGIPGKMLVGHYMRGGYCIEDHPAIDAGWYFWNGCMFDRASKPTHWMPLPAAPTSAAHTGAAGEC